MIEDRKSKCLAYSVERIAYSIKKLNATRYPHLSGRQALNAKRFLVLSFSFALCALRFTFNCYAKEVTILYTGETHAMLYTCSCPIETDGGVARRATLIKQLRKASPDALFLDSGGFFAGGILDEYTQDKQLDTQRTLVNLKAMELMKYDAVNIGDGEFNFGLNFLQENIDKINLTFLSCNISADNLNLKTNPIKQSIVKDAGGVKIGIIGIVDPLIAQKTQGLKIVEPKAAVANQVAELRKTGVNIIVLLSQLSENEDLNLVNEIKDIDILISSHHRAKEGYFTKVNSTLILPPFWQGRNLGRITFNVRDNKITDFKVERLRLSDKVSDDPDILKILPRCFSEATCKKEGFNGECQEPGSLNSSCVFSKANKVDLLIITDKECITCNTAGVIDFLKKKFPGLNVSYRYYPDKEAKALIKDLGINALPVYLLSKKAEQEKDFEGIKANLEKRGDFYLLKPQFAGFSYFFERNKIKDRFDLFISLYDKNTKQILDAVKEFNPGIHFLVTEQEGKFDAPKGNLEVEDDLRALCVQKYYPDKFWDYINCRALNSNTSWWQDCSGSLDTNKIKTCAQSADGARLLRENIVLNKELQIMLGPAYLINNQEIFASNGAPSKEELKKIIKR